MKHPKIGTFTPEEHRDCCIRNDNRTDYEWKSECGLLVLLRCGEGFVVCCGGFYDPWLGSLQEAIDFLEALPTDEED